MTSLSLSFQASVAGGPMRSEFEASTASEVSLRVPERSSQLIEKLSARGLNAASICICLGAYSQVANECRASGLYGVPFAVIPNGRSRHPDEDRRPEASNASEGSFRVVEGSRFAFPQGTSFSRAR